MREFKKMAGMLAAGALAIGCGQAFAFTAENADGVELTFAVDKTKSGTVTLTGSGRSVEGELEIPESVTYDGVQYEVGSVDDYAFQGQEGLTAVTFPESVTAIGNSSFLGCGLITLDIPDNVVSIDVSSFSANEKLLTVSLGTGLTEIPQSAFSNCWLLRSVFIGSNVTKIGDGAFYADTDINEIVSFATEPPEVGEGAFMAVPREAVVVVPKESVEKYRTAAGWDRFYYYGDTTGVEAVDSGSDTEPTTCYDMLGRPVDSRTAPAGTILVAVSASGASKFIKK